MTHCRALKLFFEDELEVLVCGSGESWTVQSLADAIKIDHGYTASSLPVSAGMLGWGVRV